MCGKVAGGRGRAADQGCIGMGGIPPEDDQKQAKTEETSYQPRLSGASIKHYFNYGIGAEGTVWSRAF